MDKHFLSGSNKWRNIHDKFLNTTKDNTINKMNECTDKTKIADEFANFYEELGKPSPIHMDIPKQSLSNNNTTISEDEIRKAIRKLINNKAAPTDIRNEMIKYGKDVMVKYLHFFFNSICWDNSTSPTCWRQGLITSLYKKGPTDDPGNYRPITLLPVFGKIYASILNDKLIEFVESNNLINTAQNGFRVVDHRNCDDHVFCLTELSTFAKYSRTPLHTCFIDFSKAFDSVPRNALLARLADLGIDTKLYHAIESMYRKTSAQALANGVKSRTFNIERGVAQGCPLSPTLFAIYINTLIDQIQASGLGMKIDDTGNLSILAYADDIVLVAENKHDLQEMVNIAYNWCEKWGMKANIAKCGIFSIHDKDADTDINWGQTTIPVVSDYKYLGVTFDNKLNWEKHINKIHGAAESKRKKLDYVFNNSNISLQLKLQMFEENIRSKMEYGSIAWGQSRPTTKLSKIQEKSLRSIALLNTGWISAIEGEMGITSLEQRRELTLLKLYFKLAHMHNNRLPKIIFNRKWRKGGTYSTKTIIHAIRRRWRIKTSPEELLANQDPENPRTYDQLRNDWINVINKRLVAFNNKRLRNNNTDDARVYKCYIPKGKRLKQYLCNYTSHNKMRLRMVTDNIPKGKCILCNGMDFNTTEHRITVVKLLLNREVI